MKIRKALIGGLVLAASCTSAMAQSSVNLYGLVDVSIGRSQAPGGTATKGVDSGKMSTSYFGARGTEDLGGGLKGLFTIESFMRADTGSVGRFNGDAFWARSAFVGLQGGFGTVTLGRNTTSLFVQTLIFNAFGDSFGFSPSIRHYFTSNTVSGDSGWNDSLRWQSPNMSGLSGTLHAALGEGNGGRNVGASALYFSGKLGMGLAYQSVDKGATVADTDTWQLAASYDFGAMKLFGQYGQVDNNTANTDFKITGIGATAPMGAGTLRVQFGEIKPNVGAKRTTLTFGYTYNLSKRTDLYGVLMSDKLKGLSTGSNYSVGIRHRF